MYKILLGSIIAMLASAPVFGAPSLTCDASGVGATTANTRMKASWTPNVYNLEWYGDEGDTTPLTVQNSAQSCDYGNTLVLPSTNPTKVGYTFIGWETEEIPAGFNYGSTCSSSVESTVAGNYATNGNDTPKPGCLDLNGDGTCKSDGYDSNASTYGITEAGQWGVNFSYGDVVGEAICSSTNGTWATTGTPDTSGSGETKYCWCRAMGYKLSGSNMCAVSSPAWVFGGGGEAADCADGCASKCASSVHDGSDFRAALFGYSSGGSSSGSGSGSACLIPSTEVSTGVWAAKSLDGARNEITSGASMATYGITQPGEWGVSWANGDKVKGVALCSARAGNNHNWQWGGDSSDWTASESTLTGTTGEKRYCWCKVTHYTANNAEQCSLSSPSWVFNTDNATNTSCEAYCARNCASATNGYLGLRAALFGDNVEQ
ncbi:MAG: InlB B-repeat-containing protein [Alphaproteobacteria bacterium]|nr:InlB B-repeat-containing protein [Alphaproteobacteria bacterium]